MTRAGTQTMSFSGARHWLARLLILLVTTTVALKVGDLALGWLRNTEQRHLLRLPANASYRHHSTEFDYTFTGNSLGLRGPERPFTKPPGTQRIAVIGDSFVAGYGVADDDVLTARLEKLLNVNGQPPTEVLNVGRTGSSTIREYDLYRLIARRFDPDVVVLAYFLGNDLREVVEEHDQEELRRWHPHGFVRRLAYGLCPNMYLELAMFKQGIATRRAKQPRTEEAVLTQLRQECEQRGIDYQTALAAYHRLPDAVRGNLIAGQLADHQILPACYDPKCVQRAIEPEEDYFLRAWPRTEDHLNMLKQAVAADGGELVVLIIPASVQIDPAAQVTALEIGYETDPDWLHGSGRTGEALAEWCQQAQIHCLDLTESLRQSSEKLYFLRDGHFNRAGHQRAAELLAEFLNKGQ